MASPDVGSGRRTLVFTAVAALIAAHVLWQVWVISAASYPVRYDYDEGVYAETAAALSAGHRLYDAVFLSQPPLLIVMISRVFDIAGRSLASARGTVAGFSILWLAALAAIGARAAGPRAAVWAVALAVSAPAFAVAAHTVQMEAPSEALAASGIALALAGALGAGAKPPRGASAVWWWGSAGLVTGLAVMVKFTAATCLVPITVLALTGPGARSGGGTALRAAALGVGGAIAAAAAVWSTGSPPGAMWRQAVEFHGAVARINPGDPGRTASLLLAFGRSNWLAVLLGLTGLAYSVAARRTPVSAHAVGAAAAPFGLWLAADLAALLLWRPIWPHHFVVLVTPLAVLGSLAVEAWLGVAGNSRIWPAASRTGAAMLIAAWLAALTGTAAATAPETSPPLRAAAAATAQLVPAGGWVVADDPIVPFLAGRATPPGLCDTSEMRMRAGWLTAADLSAAARDPRVRGVVLWRGTFREIVPPFAAGAAKDFPRRWAADGGREILGR